MGVDGADRGRSKWSQVFILLNIFVLFSNCVDELYIQMKDIFLKRHPTFFVVFRRYLFAMLLEEEVAKGSL